KRTRHPSCPTYRPGVTFLPDPFDGIHGWFLQPPHFAVSLRGERGGRSRIQCAVESAFLGEGEGQQREYVVDGSHRVVDLAENGPGPYWRGILRHFHSSRVCRLRTTSLEG